MQNVDELDPAELHAIVARLARVEGQVRGLQRSLEAGEDCRKVLSQFTAASHALRSAGLVLAMTAFETCLTDGSSPEDTKVFRQAVIAMS